MSTSIAPTSRIIPNTRFIRPIAYANLAKHKIPLPVRSVFEIEVNNKADDWPIKKKVEAANKINKSKGIDHIISIDDYEDVLKRIDLDVRLKAAVTNYKMEHLKLDNIYEDASLMIKKGREDGDAKVLLMGYKLIHDYEVNMGKLLQRKGPVKKNERPIDITPKFRDPTKWKMLTMGYKLIHDYEENMRKLLEKKGTRSKDKSKNKQVIDITPEFRDPAKCWIMKSLDLGKLILNHLYVHEWNTIIIKVWGLNLQNFLSS